MGAWKNKTFRIDAYFVKGMEELIERGEFRDQSEIIRYALRQFIYHREELVQVRREAAFRDAR